MIKSDHDICEQYATSMLEEKRWLLRQVLGALFIFYICVALLGALVFMGFRTDFFFPDDIHDTRVRLGSDWIWLGLFLLMISCFCVGALLMFQTKGVASWRQGAERLSGEVRVLKWIAVLVAISMMMLWLGLLLKKLEISAQIMPLLFIFGFSGFVSLGLVTLPILMMFYLKQLSLILQMKELFERLMKAVKIGVMLLVLSPIIFIVLGMILELIFQRTGLRPMFYLGVGILVILGIALLVIHVLGMRVLYEMIRYWADYDEIMSRHYLRADMAGLSPAQINPDLDPDGPEVGLGAGGAWLDEKD